MYFAIPLAPYAMNSTTNMMSHSIRKPIRIIIKKIFVLFTACYLVSICFGGKVKKKKASLLQKQRSPIQSLRS